MQKYINLFYIYILSITVSTLLYVSFFWTKTFIYFDFLFIKSGIFLIVSCLVVLLFILYLRIKNVGIFKQMIWQDFALIFTLTVFLNWFVYGLIPFNVSRSTSVILLKYLYDNNGNPRSINQIRDFIQDKYFNQYDSVGIRLSEQVAAGNIKEIDGNFYITPKGIFVANVFFEVSKFYNVKNNFLDSNK
jgi:hypothetical protein